MIRFWRTLKSWLRGPHPVSYDGSLFANAEGAQVNPAFRFGVQQCQILREASDLKISGTDDATAIYTAVNLPSQDHISQVAILFKKKVCRSACIGESGATPTCANGYLFFRKLN